MIPAFEGDAKLIQTPHILIGAPMHEGAGRHGCDAGPAALRAAGILDALRDGVHSASDWGDVRPGPLRAAACGNPAVSLLPDVAAWVTALEQAAFAASEGGIPVLCGGDHAAAAGTLAGMARRAAALRRPLFILWLDAHPDFHTLASTASGNLHGVPMAYAAGLPGFTGLFPALALPVPAAHICMIGIRSIDDAERTALDTTGIAVHGMDAIARHGMAPLVRRFLDQVRDAQGLLHVSLDADMLDPAIAPGVGTPVPGGVTRADALHLMQALRDSGLVTSLDIVELNPLVDRDGRTARLLVELAAALMGGQASAQRTGVPRDVVPA
jgi:arginase